MGIDGNYRSPQVEKITISGTKMNSVTCTMSGVAQLKKLNPYSIFSGDAVLDYWYFS